LQLLVRLHPTACTNCVVYHYYYPCLYLNTAVCCIVYINLGSFSNRGAAPAGVTETVAPSAILRNGKGDHISKNKLKVSELSDSVSLRSSCSVGRQGDDGSVFSFASGSSGGSAHSSASASTATRSTVGHKTKRWIVSEHYVESALVIQKQQKQRVEVSGCVNVCMWCVLRSICAVYIDYRACLV